MQVIPNVPTVEATGSERKVLSLLRSVDWGGVTARALNSLNLAEHAYQRWGEIDFLLVGTKGLIAIEVKGGDVSCKDGRWHYEDRIGRVVTRSKSPLVQAKDAYFSLDKNYVSPRLGAGFSTSHPAGFCVILAGMGRGDLKEVLGGPEFPAELIGTRDDLANPAKLQKFLEGVAQYWAQKNGSSKKIPEHHVTELVRLFRPEFERVQALALARERFHEEMIALTEEQYEILDHWAGADRIYCSSPAGCGKTLLAAEMARRAIAAGDTVLLLVGTSALGDYLRLQPDISGVVASMSSVLATPEVDRPKVRVLIVDEGQQLLSNDNMKVLDSLVEGGLREGRWAWFGDVSFQAPCPHEEMEAGISVLSGAATVRPRLTKNCRNTPEIITTVELAAGIPLGHAVVSGRGQPPSMPDIGGRPDAPAAVARQIKAWLSENISLANITLLTNDDDADGLAAEVGRIGGFQVGPWVPGTKSEMKLQYARLDEFRGLESGLLVLCLTASPSTEDELGRYLYLGMTRANFALSIVAAPEILERIRKRMASNAMKSLNGG